MDMMIYIIGLLCGIINGVFASGAGQIFVFYLIFIAKLETHRARALSVAVLSIASIFAIFGYQKLVHFEISVILILALLAGIGGIIGAKWMKKVSANLLNLLSGIIIVGLTLYRLISGG